MLAAGGMVTGWYVVSGKGYMSRVRPIFYEKKSVLPYSHLVGTSGVTRGEILVDTLKVQLLKC